MWLNRFSLSWRFSIIDIALFILLFFTNNTSSLKETVILFSGALALRIFFIMLLMELASVFVISLKRWLPVMFTYIICFIIGYVVILLFARQMMSDYSFKSFLFLVHTARAYSCYLLPYITACVFFLWGLRR